MQEESTFKIKNLRKTGIKKDPIVDGNGEVVQPGSRILKGYWGDWLVFGSKVPGYTLKLKIRITPSGSKIRLINPLMTPDNNWENKRTSVYVDWGDGRYDKFYKKKINSGRFNRNSPYTLEHNYTAQVGDEMWLSITSIEPLVPYGCDIIEMLGQFPYDRYDLNMDRDGHYCGLFGVDQYIETYPELNKLYGAGKTITKVSSELLDNWRDIGNMNRMFEGWGITEVPTNFFKYSNKFHPDPKSEGIYQRHNMIVDTCKSYYRTFANCPNLVTVGPGILAGVQSATMTTEEMFDNCPKLTNTLYYSGGDALENASKMYRDCVSLESVSTGHFISSLSKLRTIESIFDGCSNLHIIDWDKFCAKAVNLINAKAAFRGTAFTEVAFNMREMTQLGSIEYMYADMIHLRKAISSSGSNTASKYQYWKHSQKEGQNKLRISHLFENSGDRILGMIIGENFFHNLSSKDRLSYESAFPNETRPSTMNNTCEPTHTDASYVFAGAFIDKYEPNDYSVTVNDMVSGLGGYGNSDIGYDVSHFFDGCTFVNNMNYISLDRVFGSWRIHYFNYTFANLKSRIGYINTLNLFGPYLHLVRSVVGLFKNCTIDHRFNDYNMFGGLPQGDSNPISGLLHCEDYSEMFMNVVYEFPDIPVDHIICNTYSYQYGDDKKLTVVKARDMFTGSNMQCYRPISPLSDRRLSYDMHNFIEKTSAPKEWVMNGFYDTSDWQPIIEVKPFIMWVFIEIKNTTFVLDRAPKVVDWGDGSSTSEDRHTYLNTGYYKISITDANFCQPDSTSQQMIYKLDGELPYGANAIFENSSQTNGVYIQEIGPQVACLASSAVFKGLTGVIHPENYKYGTNNGLMFGVKSIDISEPSHTEIMFESEFIVIDSTTSVTLDITITPLYIGHNTNVYLNLGIDRLDRSQHHISLTESNPLWIPAQMLVMTDIHNSKDYKIDYGVNQFKMQDTGYLTSKHFARLKNIKKIPQLNNYKFTLIGQQSKYRISGSINKTSFPGLEEFGPNSNIGSCYMCAESPNIIDINNTYDNRKPKFIRDYIDFELENIPDEEISFFRLDHLPNSPTEFKDRPIGNVIVEILLYDEDEDETNPERRLEFNNVLPNIGKIVSKDKKALVRVRADVPLWPSCKNSIVGVYGIINNKEGDMRIHPYDIWMGNGGGQKLAPNIKHISEDLLWGLNDVHQSFTNMFNGTPIEEIPANLLNYYFGYNTSQMFANCTKLKVVPDNLIKTNSLHENQHGSGGIFNAQGMFSGCTNIEYVFKPFQDGVCHVKAYGMFKGCKTYAFKDSNDVDKDVLNNVSVDYRAWYEKKTSGNATGLTKMIIPNTINVPLLNHDNDGIIISKISTVGDVKVGRYFANSFNLALYKDDPQMLNSVRIFMNDGMDFNMTSDEVFKAFHSMKSLAVFERNDNRNNTFASGEIPKHNMLFSNSKLNRLFGLFKGVGFNYTPNLLFIRQDGMRKANGLLIYANFDKIPYTEYVPATHLPDRVGRPIYIGGAKNATRYRPRIIDRMLRYRNDWINISYFMKGVSGELTCPTFNNFITRDQIHAFSFTDTMVSDETFTNIDRTSNIGKNFNSSYVSNMFESNTSIKSDCNVFHIWHDATDASATYKNTTMFLHPPKDMFNDITQLVTMHRTFEGSSIRDLPNCNSRVKSYIMFAASSKLSTIPEHWFKYSGTETLDITYAFDNCSGLIITHKIIDPTVTVPVLKYSSLRNAWSIIGDDPEIFAGVNTKLDGTDKSLIRVIPETDLFRQTLDIHDSRWTLSVKALGMETIGNESVQDDNLFMVSWGDGTDPSVVSYRDIEWADYSHKYEANGRYQVMILSTQWCCYINSPQDLSSKYTTYSIDGMLQNSTCRAVCDTGLTNMFGFTVEKVFPTMFDKLSDVATVKDLPELFFNFNKLKEIPETILHKMASLESIYRFAMYTPITELPAKLLSKNPKLKNANSIAERCYSLITIPSELFKLNPDLETIQRGFCDIQTLTDVPRDLLSNNPNLLNIENMFSHCDNMVIDNTYDNFLANQTKLVNAMHLFRNWTIKQLPPNLLNRCVNLQIVEGMFELQDFNDAGFDSIDDARFNNFFKKMAERDTEFDIPANWLPKSVVNSGTMFFFRTKLKSYPSDLFTGNTVLNKASYMFMNTAIRRIHNETFKTMSHTHELNLTRWIYKDKRFGKTFYIHYCPKVVSSAINVPSVVTESMLLGVYGTMTEAQLFSGVTTDPSNIHSLYVQEFEPAKFKLKMTGDGTFITFKPITKSDVTFTDLTMVQWGDGTEDLWEEPIAKADIQKVIKHNYKTPGEYTISVGAKYCLVPIVDDLPEAYQVESVVFPEDIDQVKQVSIGGEYGVGDLKINRDMIYATKQNAEVELSLVPRPHYVGETYTVDVTVEPRGLEVGEQTTVELNIVRDTSDPFERLEISGTLGPMEGYTEFPRVAEMPELQYKKWSGTETFFSRNTQITSFNRSFMNLNYEFRIADKVFQGLPNLTHTNHCFWNTKLVVEPGWAPDFNKCTKLRSVNSMFRAGLAEDVGKTFNGIIYIPAGTPVNKVTWKVNQDQYQPFSNLSSITDMGYIHNNGDITYAMTTNMSNMTNLQAAYTDAKSLSYLRADFFRTLKSSGTINCSSVFTDTSSLRTIQPAPDGKTLFEFTIGNNEVLRFDWTFAGSALPIATVIDLINKSSFIKTTASGTNVDINNLFSWCRVLQSTDASALRLAIPSRTGTLDMTDLFSYDSDPSTTNYDKDVTMLYNIKPGAITIVASGSPNVIVDNMFDHCYADAAVSDAHECFVVTGDDSNFNKAKALADSSALNTLTVMTTTVVPK